MVHKFLKDNYYKIEDFDIKIKYTNKLPKWVEEVKKEEDRPKKFCPVCNSECQEINMRYYYCTVCKKFM